MGNFHISTMLGRSASVAQKSASPCLQLLNSSIQQQNVQPARGMANLKAIAIRLKSVKNIQKITQSFYEHAQVGPEEGAAPEGKTLYVAMTSDRGLCGGVHSSICKTIRNELLEKPAGELENVGIICVGDKARAQLSRLFSKQILSVGSEIGRLPPQFGDAAKIATNILNSGFDFDQGKMYYNEFKSVVSYQTKQIAIYPPSAVEKAKNLSVYDSLDSDVMQSYLEFSLASMIYYTLKEGACSEQSSRMTAMDNSSKNAG